MLRSLSHDFENMLFHHAGKIPLLLEARGDTRSRLILYVAVIMYKTRCFTAVWKGNTSAKTPPEKLVEIKNS